MIFDRWARLVDPFVDEFGDPIPNDEADDRITLNLLLPTAKRLIRLLQKAVAALEIEEELVDAYDKRSTRQTPDGVGDLDARPCARRRGSGCTRMGAGA
jgi:hypothetical protein